MPRGLMLRTESTPWQRRQPRPPIPPPASAPAGRLARAARPRRVRRPWPSGHADAPCPLRAARRPGGRPRRWQQRCCRVSAAARPALGHRTRPAPPGVEVVEVASAADLEAAVELRAARGVGQDGAEDRPDAGRPAGAEGDPDEHRAEVPDRLVGEVDAALARELATSIAREAQPGIPRPRLFRLPADSAQAGPAVALAPADSARTTCTSRRGSLVSAALKLSNASADSSLAITD